jgi:hypothetical protein
MTFGGVDSAAFDTIAVATTQSALIVLTTYTLLDAVLTLAAPLPPEGASFLLSLLNTKITETGHRAFGTFWLRQNTQSPCIVLTITIIRRPTVTETECQLKGGVSKAEWKSGLRYYCYRNHTFDNCSVHRSVTLDYTNMDVFFGCDK